jgi:hypothetical protein
MTKHDKREIQRHHILDTVDENVSKCYILFFRKIRLLAETIFLFFAFFIVKSLIEIKF